MSVASIEWRACANCTTTFLPKQRPDRNRLSRGQYCSPDCSSDARRISPEAQLAKKVDRSGGLDACWPWTGRIESTGYGRFWHRGKALSAHVAAWEIANRQETPKGRLIRHLCPGGGNAWCCNPSHLSPGTHQDNSDDKVQAGRQCRGERINTARLTEQDVRAIRQRYERGQRGAKSSRSPYALAAEYAISQGMIWRIVTRRSWRHVT